MKSPRSSVLRLVAAGVVGLWSLAAATEPIAPVAMVTDALKANPRCQLQILMLQEPVPSASEVGIPVFPDSLFTGVTRAGSGQINGTNYEMLASVFLLTTAEPDEVADFYAEALDDTWTRGLLYGSHVFYQHEPVDDVAALLFARPGALPVVELVDVWSDCDRALLPDARTAIRLYYPPAPAP